MFAFPGLDGCVNGSNKFNQVKNYNGNNIGNVSIGYYLITEKNRNRPPESNAVHEQQRELRQECLSTVPANKISSPSVSHIKNKCGNQVDDGKWKASNCGYQRHQITIGSFLSFMFCRCGADHNSLYIFQIQFANNNKTAGMANLFLLKKDSVCR